MSLYNWIRPEDYTMDVYLHYDRWVLDYLLSGQAWYPEGRDYKTDLARALSRYPHVKAFCRHKAPECAAFLDEVERIDVSAITQEEFLDAQRAIMEAQETFVVYAYPEVMNQLGYIRHWDEQYLHRLLDLTGLVVLDVGAGTGRLTFAAAKKARRVYASEPCDMLREFMRDEIKRRSIPNVRVLDGYVTALPFEDDTFDAVLSGHVVGDLYDEEIAEMSRVVKPGGWLIICNGDDTWKRDHPNPELTRRGFEAFRHENAQGGVIFDYRMQVAK